MPTFDNSLLGVVGRAGGISLRNPGDKGVNLPPGDRTKTIETDRLRGRYLGFRAG
jgi:hypothetical protein